MSLLQYDFMQRALLAALLVGMTAPAVGVYLVQRRQAFMGDGIGHIALTGVGLGLLLDRSPVLLAVLTAAAGAVVIELVREHSKVSGDLALSVMFYGGIAGGVMLASQSEGNSNLDAYLFGQLTSVAPEDIQVIVILAIAVLAVTIGLRRPLFTVCQDEEFARVTGLPVRALNLLIAVTAAVTVTVAMRVVGLLLVSALMVVPVAIAQQLTRTFAVTMATAIAVGVAVSVSGTTLTYYVDAPPGATIVLIAIALFVLVGLLTAPLNLRRAARRAAAVSSAEVDVDVAATVGAQRRDASTGSSGTMSGTSPAPTAVEEEPR
ncbi:metal ABC transporter permease [Yinghuangia seranimata]|uniref:metal ABC transporter permease n=1 Tax=Yinghuangia seranimata TaxID=408067 RepID=UPI00248C669C|nr:metal ABC transporter permease [Yinghuangia seranimata]MDI2127490.1 metal ABC transporter permease [Yinghuangia seranimata]